MQCLPTINAISFTRLPGGRPLSLLSVLSLPFVIQYTAFSFCHWLSSGVLLSNDSFLAVDFLITKNNSAAIVKESHHDLSIKSPGRRIPA